MKKNNDCVEKKKSLKCNDQNSRIKIISASIGRINECTETNFTIENIYISENSRCNETVKTTNGLTSL